MAQIWPQNRHIINPKRSNYKDKVITQLTYHIVGISWFIKKQIIWRRNKIQDLLIKGNTQYLIADILKVSQTTVSRDIDYLREQAGQNMQTHLQDRLPEEYENCMAGINQVLMMSWDIATKGQGNGDSSNSNSSSGSDRTLSSTVDDRTRLQALALANDCYKYKMDLVTNGVVITDAIKFVQQKKEELAKVNAENDNDIKDSNNNTRNKIF